MTLQDKSEATETEQKTSEDNAKAIIQHLNPDDPADLNQFIGQEDSVIKRIPAGYFGILDWTNGGMPGKGYIERNTFVGPGLIGKWIFGCGKRRVSRLIPKADQQFQYDLEAVIQEGVYFSFSTTLTFKVTDPRKFIDVAGEKDPENFGHEIVKKIYMQIFTARIDGLASNSDVDAIKSLNDNLQQASLIITKPRLKKNFDEITDKEEREKFIEHAVSNKKLRYDKKINDLCKRYGVEIIDFSIVQINPTEEIRKAQEEKFRTITNIGARKLAARVRGEASATTLAAFTETLKETFPGHDFTPGEVMNIFETTRRAVAIGERPPASLVLDSSSKNNSSDIGALLALIQHFKEPSEPPPTTINANPLPAPEETGQDTPEPETPPEPSA